MIKIFFLLFSIYPVFAQSIEDSLLTKLANTSPQEKIIYLDQLCWNLRSNDPDRAIQYGLTAVELIKKIDEPIRLSQTYNFIGVAYRNLGNYSKALTYYSRALSNAITFSDSIQIAYSHNNLGGIYRLQGNNPIAIEHMLNAIKIFEERDFKTGIGFCSINIGVLYSNQGNYSKALEYLELSKKVRELENDTEGLIHSVKHIARTYFRMGNYDLSLEYYHKLMDLALARNDLKGIAAVYEGFSDIDFKLKNYSSALESIEKAIDINEQIEYKAGVTANLFMKGIIYASMNNITLGEKYLEQANLSVNETDNELEKLEGMKYQSMFHEILGEYDLSLNYYKKYSSLRDSIFSAESSEDLYVQMTEHLLEKEQDELKRDLEIRNQQIKYLSIIVVLILVVILVIFWRFVTLKKLSAELKESNITKDKFFRILAHDLRNPINASMGYLQLLKDNKDPFNNDEKEEIISNAHSSLSKNVVLLDNLLEWAKIQNKSSDFNPQNVDLKTLINDTIENHLPLSKSKNLTLESDADNSCKAFCDIHMIQTVLRNLITNSIKFTPDGGFIKIKCKKEGENLEISVSDSGIGIPRDEQNKIFKLSSKFTNRGTNNELGSGLGLILCKEYVELNGGEIRFTTEENEGSTFTFTLPLNGGN